MKASAPAWALAVVILCACKSDGDGDGAGSCGSISACGGDIEGTWNVDDLCISNVAELAGMAVDEPACSNLFVGADVAVTGTMTFTAGAATSNATMTVDLHAIWTKACIEAVANISNADVAAACASLDMEYSMNPQFSGGSCMVAGTTCDCIVSSERAFTLGAGYAIDGSQVTFTGDEPSAFCVEGDTLTIAGKNGQTDGIVTLSR